MTSIYAALAAVMADVDHVAKRDVNKIQRFTFRGIDAVVNAVGPSLRKHKVIVVPNVVRYDYGEIHVGEKRTPMGHARVIVAYTFYGPDGDSIATSAPGEAFDSGDKATPKAMSVAFRTALLQALALPTDEADPDASSYERSERSERVNGHADPLAVAKDRAWHALKQLRPKDDNEGLLAFASAAMEARGSAIGSADADTWNALADEWSAA